MNDHLKHIQAHMEMIAGISSVLTVNARTMTVEDWLLEEYITKTEQLTYPNARTAADIKSSPLGKALA